MSKEPPKPPHQPVFSNCRKAVTRKFPDQCDDALMYMDYFEDENVAGDGFDQFLSFSEVLHQPALEQIAIVLKSNPSIVTSEDEEKGNRKLARALGKKFPQLIKQTPEAQQFFYPQPRATKKSAPPLVIERTRAKDGKTQTAIHINLAPILFLLAIAVVGFLLLRSCQ